MIDVDTLRQRLSASRPRPITEFGTDQAAVAVILVGSSGAVPEVLLIKRAQRDGDPWSGQMAFPGGRRELDDGDLVDTACRETLEETGVVLGTQDVVGKLDDIRPLGPRLPRIIVRPFVFLLASTPEVVTNIEVDLFLWVRLSDLPELAGTAQVRENGKVFSVPAFNIGPHVVWGLTERILKSFINLCV